jgi:hypothetical protein
MVLRLPERLSCMTAALRQARYQDLSVTAMTALATLFQAKAEVQQAIASLHNRRVAADILPLLAFPPPLVHSLAVLNTCTKCSFVRACLYRTRLMHKV